MHKVIESDEIEETVRMWQKYFVLYDKSTTSDTYSKTLL